MVNINLDGFENTLSYYVICDAKFVGNTFQWGLVVEVSIITVLVFVVALYSKAWSLGGRGFEFNVWFLLVAGIIIVLGAIVGSFSFEVANIWLIISTFVFSIFGVAICVN